MYTRIRVHTYVRSQFERDRGLNNKTRIYTGNDRWCREGRRPCGAHKASPRLIPLSCSSLFSSALHCRGIPAGRKREASTRDPVREAASSLLLSYPPAAPVPSLFCRHFVDPFARFVPGQACTWPCTTARSYHRLSVVPSPGVARRGGRCIAPRRPGVAAW